MSVADPGFLPSGSKEDVLFLFKMTPHNENHTLIMS